MSTSTPWGAAQYSDSICRGIVQYGTAGHGGVHLSPTRNMVIPEYMRNDNGWYEEDCEWSIPATIFPEAWVSHYDESILKIIKATLLEYYPDMYEQYHGVKLKESDSSERDKQQFETEHKNDWVVISAIGKGDIVECIATIGGWHHREGEEKTFIVSDKEYATRGNHSFVIDPKKHVEKGNEPTWQDTLYDHHGVGGPYNEMSDMINEAYKLGYSYMCWNGRIYSINMGDRQPYEIDTGFVMDDVK